MLLLHVAFLFSERTRDMRGSNQANKPLIQHTADLWKYKQEDDLNSERLSSSSQQRHIWVWRSETEVGRDAAEVDPAA